MRTLKDSKSREWEVSLSLAAAQRIDNCDFSDLTDKQISILNVQKADCMRELLDDAAIVFACIWCCIKPQADKLGVTQEEFTESVDGTVVQDGKEVWAEELADFFPELKIAFSRLINTKKENVKKARKRMEKLSDNMGQLMADQMDKEMDKAEREIKKEMTKTNG